MHRGKAKTTPEREAEVAWLLKRVRRLSHERSDIEAVGLAGSWAHGVAGMESDVDLIILTTEKESCLKDDGWMHDLGGIGFIRTQDWGPLYTERRFVTASGLEVEFGVAPPEWAATSPPDPSVSKEVRNGGLRPVYDPERILGRFIRACESVRGSGARPTSGRSPSGACSP
ncbi:MAG: nucleotidyltransferase domain-containing protein [Rubrobacter sp.]